MARMLNRNWKGGKHPCSCCCGGPIAVGRAGEEHQWRIEVSREQYDDILADEPRGAPNLIAYLRDNH